MGNIPLLWKSTSIRRVPDLLKSMRLKFHAEIGQTRRENLTWYLQAVINRG